MTRKKLKLDEEALQVESFASAAVPEERGTVHGHYSGAYHPACVTGCPMCYKDSSEYQSGGQAQA